MGKRNQNENYFLKIWQSNVFPNVSEGVIACLAQRPCDRVTFHPVHMQKLRNTENQRKTQPAAPNFRLNLSYILQATALIFPT